MKNRIGCLIIIAACLLIPRLCIALDMNCPSLSYSKIQSCLTQVGDAGGGTVYLPSGTSDWFTSALEMRGGVNLIGQGVDQTTLRWNSDNGNGIQVNEVSPRIYTAFRISGLNLIGTYHGNAIGSMITMRSNPGFRIDHVNIEGGRYVISVGNEVGQLPSTGLIDHCYIKRGATQNYNTPYGVSVSAREYISDKALGTGDAVFIEDCTIEDMGHPVGAFGGSHYVLRYSNIIYSSNSAAFPIDAHGPGFTYFNGVTRGARAWEIYNNVIIGDPSASTLAWRACGLRAGKGVVYNNDIRNFRHAVTFYCDSYTCNNSGLDHIHGAYIWGNTLTNVTEETVLVQDDTCSQTYIKLDRDYFMRHPTKEQDGFTWTPYTYPHPLQSGPPPDQPPEAPTNLTITNP